MSNNTQPEIRFPGFTEDWEQRKLGDFVVDYVEKTSVQNQFPMLTSSQQKGIVLQEDYFANRQVTTENNIGYFVLPRGYFTFRSRSDNDVFVFNRNDIIDRGIISYFYPVFTLKSADSDFFLRRINNGIQRQLSIQAEGTGQHVLSLKKFKNIVAMFPSEEEQQKIGSFFKRLDDTIALHQRKLDLLKETKKGFLQKMFPKNGAKVPEIRFPGFTEDWEQRKAKELFIPKAEKNQPELPVLSVTQDHGVVYREQVGIDIKYDKATLKNYKVIHQGDFVISLRSFQGGFELSDKLGITSPAYTIFVPKNMDSQDNLFWKTKFKTFTFIESLKTVTFGIRDGKSISFSEFGDLKLFFPKNIEEQQKIGNFFKQLDDTITLHQRKLDLLKEMKKGFLQKMFV
ncbi:restriction endonuclease subunit S [Enterococcus faecium]|uniref:restriction endonuclease subunit S n=1 Tax=Enterococcus faecium TaxID=1352 RepID=UPI002D1ECEB1